MSNDLSIEVDAQQQLAARFTQIKTPSDAREAAEFIQTIIRPLKKKVEEAFDPIIAAANETLREAREQKKKLLIPLEKREALIKGALVSFQEQQLAEQAKVIEDNTAKAFAAGVDDNNIPIKVPQAPIPMVTKVKGLSFLERVDFEITDEGLLPREYLTPNLPLIKKEVVRLGRLADITGVRVFVKTSPMVR